MCFTEGFLLLRACERFGKDPAAADRDWSPGMKRLLIWFDRLRHEQEAKRQRALAGADPRGAR